MNERDQITKLLVEIKYLTEQLEKKREELDKQQELEIELIQWVADEVSGGILSLNDAHSMYDEFHRTI